MGRNYIVADGIVTTHYFYLDREPYVADRIFIDECLPVHFRGDFVRDDMPYALVHVWVWRWQGERMEKCLRRLYTDSLIKNRDDYPRACDELRELFRGAIGEDAFEW